jgi:ectoine hydroxylase-related dioxygenase (phytanoyl-CoA dioxygenase family)
VVLDHGEVDALLAEERRFRPRARGTLLVRTQLCHRSAPVREFCAFGRHVAMVADLLGPNVCLTHQQFIAKLPDDPETTSEISFHQDNGYGRLDPPTDVTVWVALHDTDERNGCLLLIPRSHELGVLPHGPAGVNPYLREAAADTSHAVALPMRAGEAVAFSGQTLHASGPNLTDQQRVGLFARYCEPHVIMVTEGNRPVLEDGHSWMVLGEYGG